MPLISSLTALLVAAPVAALVASTVAAPALPSDPHPRIERKVSGLDPRSLADGEGRHPYGFWRDLERPRRDVAVQALERPRRIDSVGREVGAQQ